MLPRVRVELSSRSSPPTRSMQGRYPSTHLSTIRRAEIKPLLLASVLFVWLVAGGALINRWIPALLS